MFDNKTMPRDLDLLIASMDDLAREVGKMDLDDPVRAVRLKELYTLTELSKSLKTEQNGVMDNERSDALRREVDKEIAVGAPIMHLIFRLPL
ncbi:MAG TPA: hypothetical protein VFA77_01225, partial [Candidatus Eisenbacteria bacterium]|nr:hypothetical protein [Candidatus Eisenbacteria bacterium]